MTTAYNATTAAERSDRTQHPNHLLRRARLRLPSPRNSSRQELAEAVNAHVFDAIGRLVSMDAHYVGRLERGQRRWPGADYRSGLRAVLGVATDAEIGFYLTRRTASDEKS